ncbi:hypothetical protein GIY09_08675 [Aerococcaceae bacterium WS4759]|uniref:Uncharacterized protein n=1 Tax=Fundicoccus ignavus TaxID=2664442 RepID=A0A6I2GKZ3_9LACT|nr:hypothetical protein [Fundicoccus ignavus]MRI85939.1 hypothetical protein [Fundicoccus ignavus]
MLSIYLFFKFNTAAPLGQRSEKWIPWFEGAFIGLIGLVIMNFAIVIEQVRLDFRPLLLAITFKYIGRKASIIGLVIITLGRFTYGLYGTSIVNLAFAIYVIIS